MNLRERDSLCFGDNSLLLLLYFKCMSKSGKTNKRRNSGVRKFFKITGIVFLLLFVISILFPVIYKWVNPPVTPLMLIRKVDKGYSIEHEWRDLDRISPYMVQCAVSSEDNNFLGHNGFDYGAIEKAIEESESGKRRRGASTISQQTAKNVFLWPRSSWFRKGLEAYFTFLIEHIWSKERIMEVYLNVIEMGPGIYGAEAAAQHYYHTDAAHLTQQQSALITACYPAPLHRDPSRPTSYLKKRAAQIIHNARCIGKIDFEEETIKKARQRYEAREEMRRAKKKKRQ